MSQLSSDGAARPAANAAVAKRFLPLAILAVLVASIFALDLHHYLTFSALQEHRHLLLAYVEGNALQAVAVFVLVYAASTAASLPGAAILSIAGGFLFGALAGTLAVVVGATTGAVVVFLIAKSALGDSLRKRTGGALKSMERGFQENALSYLLFLRLVPVFPFFLVNLVSAFLGVSLRTYVIATSVGIIPGSFVFAITGAGLGSVFDSAESFSPASVLTTEVVVALVGLSLLSLTPILYKKVRGRRVAT